MKFIALALFLIVALSTAKTFSPLSFENECPWLVNNVYLASTSSGFGNFHAMRVYTAPATGTTITKARLKLDLRPVLEPQDLPQQLTGKDMSLITVILIYARSGFNPTAANLGNGGSYQLGSGPIPNGVVPNTQYYDFTSTAPWV